MMKATRITLLAVSLMFAVTATLFAENGRCKKDHAQDCDGEKNGHHSRRGNRGGGFGKMMKDLNLTEDQKEQLKAIRDSYKDKMKDVHKAMGEARKALQEAASGDDINEAEIRELSKKIGDAMADMAIIKAKIKKELNGILTDEQKEKFEEKKAEMKKRMEQRRKKFQEKKQQRKGKRNGKDNDDNDDDE